MAKLDSPDIRTAVKQYVKASGVLTDAWIIAGYKHKSGFYAYLAKHPAFHAELNTIKHYADPAVNAALIAKAHQAVEMNLEHGAAKKISDRDPDTGNMVLNRVIQTGASKWAVELVLKSPTVTETALKMVIASQIYEITRDPALTTEVKSAFYHFLDRFKRQQLIELIQKGCPVKDDVG
jgi:hypothetical protein